MEYLEKIYRFCDSFSITVRNVRPFSKTLYYLLFMILVRFFKPQKYFYFEGKKIYFYSFDSTLYSLEEIFFTKSVDFKNSKKDPVIIDAGANVGISALYYKSLYPKAQITCIEPVPQTFKMLQKNLSPYPDITTINAAVSDTLNPKIMYVPKKDVFDASLSAYSTRWGKQKLKKVKVNTTKLSSIIKNQAIDCLILDIEGDEDKILVELDKNKKVKQIKNIFIEFHSYPGNSLGTISTILEKNGFDVVYGCGVRPPFHKYLNKFHALPLYARQKNS